MLTHAALTKDEKKQRLRKIIDKKPEEEIQHDLSNPQLFACMPPLERINPKPPGTLYLPTDISICPKSDSPLTNNQSQNLRTIKKQRWKSSQEIIAPPCSSYDGQKELTDIGITRNYQSSDHKANDYDGQKEQTDIGITRNDQSSDHKAIDKKNR